MQEIENNPFFKVSYFNLRIALGFVGILLPIVLVLGAFLFNDCVQLQPSISHYYYTNMGNVFVGALCAVAMFLFFYKGPGKNKTDAIVANIAGVAALLVAFFPTDADAGSTCKFVHYFKYKSVEQIHYAAAGVLFLCFAFFCLFLFTKTHLHIKMTNHKMMSNNIFKTCGVIILTCIILIAVYNFANLQNSFSKYKPTFILESIALFAFGISWVTKAEMFLKG